MVPVGRVFPRHSHRGRPLNSVVRRHMVTCPKCKQRAMSPWRRFGMGPSGAQPCASCGEKLRASWWGLPLVGLGTFAVLRAGSHMPTLGTEIAANMVGVTAIFTLLYLLPLVRRDV